ncbi:LCP family protein [Geodermatophilus sp. SYSU D01186]
MLARFAGDRQHAQLISIPRDSWVGRPRVRQDKINAAYAFGGPSLLIQTVEQLTAVRIDHYVAIDFRGPIQVTDDLGGVDVVVAETTSNGPYTFPAGVNHLDGDQALVPGSALQPRRRRLRPGEAPAAVPAVAVRPAVRLRHLHRPRPPGCRLLAVTSAVAVDDELGNGDMLSLAHSLRGLHPDDVEFFTAPALGTGTGTEGSASVVCLDGVACDRMWAYLGNDSLTQNADEFSGEALPDVWVMIPPGAPRATGRWVEDVGVTAAPPA